MRQLKFIILIITIAIAVTFLTSSKKPIQATGTVCATPVGTNPPLSAAASPIANSDGLISAAGSLGIKYDNPRGICITNPAVNTPLLSYANLKDKFITQYSGATTNSATTIGPFNFTTSINTNYTGNLTVNGDLTAGSSVLAVIFVEGNLTINNNITYADNDYSSGLVLVVNGNVDINPAVNQINAFIIANGDVYTAGSGCTKSNVLTASPLVIKGSLTSLKAVALSAPPPIKFCRKLADNKTTPAEQVIFDPKFLVIFKNSFGQAISQTTEILR